MQILKTSKMHYVICVLNKNNAFEEFKHLDSQIQNAVFALYDKFSEFNQPIIS